MTVSSSSNKAGPFAGNDVATVFSFPGRVLQTSDVKVYQRVVASGVTTEVTSGITKALIGDGASGATVTFATPPTTGVEITLVRAVNMLQDDYDPSPNSTYYAEVLEGAIDKRVMQIQQVDEKVERSLRGAVTETVDMTLPSSVSRAKSLLGFDVNGAPIVAGGLPENANAAPVTATGSTNPRSLGDRFADVVNVKDFGARGDGVTDDTAAINAAISAAGAAGGGLVFIPPGVYALSNSNPLAASWDNYRAIYVGANDVHLLGAGIGATVLRLLNGANCHAIKFGQRVDGAVTVSNCSVRNVEIDGNRSNQTTPGETDNHWDGINVSSGCQRVTLSDLHVRDCAYYGIGMQRDAIKDCRIQNVVIENTGADGVDWKNDSGAGGGNVIANVRVANFGNLTALLTPQAGVDLRSGIYAENIVIESMTAKNDLVGVRTQGDGDATSVGVATQPPRVRGVVVTGANGVNSVGVRVGTRNTEVSGAIIRACGDGVRVSRPDVRLHDIDVHACSTGIRLFQDATTALEADTVSVSSCVVRDCTAAGLVLDSVDEATIAGSDVRNNLLGYDLRSGSTNIRIIGGSCVGNTTQVTDNGTNTVIRDVTGYRTRNIVSGTADIASTGTKTINIAHGLPFTPATSDVLLTLRRNTNVGDWSAGFLFVTACDATNITAQLRVLSASATGGAIVDVVATIESKAG